MKLSIISFCFSLLSWPSSAELRGGRRLTESCNFGPDGVVLAHAVQRYLTGDKEELIEDCGEIGQWDVSQVENFPYVFSTINGNTGNFNDDISTWNTSSATNMESMFNGAVSFNQDLSGWSTGDVENFGNMFAEATAFEGVGLETWDTSSATNMEYMFSKASSFNQALGNWSTGAVENFGGMFREAATFEGVGLEKWDTSSATNMEYMFFQASSFNTTLSDWSTGAVTNFRDMFRQATVFEGAGLETWDVSAATQFRRMFKGAKAFNTDISGWKPNAAQNMKKMFNGASAMATNLCNWNDNIDDLANLNVRDMFTDAVGCEYMFKYESSSWHLSTNNYSTDFGHFLFLCGLCI